MPVVIRLAAGQMPGDDFSQARRIGVGGQHRAETSPGAGQPVGRCRRWVSRSQPAAARLSRLADRQLAVSRSRGRGDGGCGVRDWPLRHPADHNFCTSAGRARAPAIVGCVHISMSGSPRLLRTCQWVHSCGCATVESIKTRIDDQPLLAGVMGVVPPPFEGLRDAGSAKHGPGRVRATSRDDGRSTAGPTRFKASTRAPASTASNRLSQSTLSIATSSNWGTDVVGDPDGVMADRYRHVGRRGFALQARGRARNRHLGPGSRDPSWLPVDLAAPRMSVL